MATRIAVLTGGGDCPGLNAVLRAVVKTASLGYGMEVVGVEDGFAGLIEERWRMLRLEDVSGLLPRGGTVLGTTNRENPFRYPVNEDGETVYKDLSDKVLDNLRRVGAEGLIIIGGDGSMKIGMELQAKGLPVIGVPKTIDNDLSATDYTFGFDTAVSTATEALDRLHTTAESHHRVMVLEVMGRYAGWIALHAGLAGGADIILIPEIPFALEKVCQKVLRRREEGKKFSVAVVAEGAAPAGGKMVVQRVIPESGDPIRLGGIGEQVGRSIEEATGIETRVTVLGHLQRGGSPSPFDRILATRLGDAAARLAAEGDFGKMVALHTPRIEAVPLEEAVGQLKKVDPDSDLVRAARDIGIGFGD